MSVCCELCACSGSGFQLEYFLSYSSNVYQRFEKEQDIASLQLVKKEDSISISCSRKLSRYSFFPQSSFQAAFINVWTLEMWSEKFLFRPKKMFVSFFRFPQKCGRRNFIFNFFFASSAKWDREDKTKSILEMNCAAINIFEVPSRNVLSFLPSKQCSILGEGIFEWRAFFLSPYLFLSLFWHEIRADVCVWNKCKLTKQKSRPGQNFGYFYHDLPTTIL